MNVRCVRRSERGRVDSNKVVDQKFYRLRTIRTNPIQVTITDNGTGEITKYKSQYEACKETGKDDKFFARNNGKVVKGKLYQIGLAQ